MMLRKVLESGTYCSRCDSFFKDETLLEVECWCSAEDWKPANIEIVETKSLIEMLKEKENVDD